MLTIYHDGPGGSTTVPVVADGTRGMTAELTEGLPTGSIQAITPFEPAYLGYVRPTKTVYLQVSGEIGQLAISGFKVEGSQDIVVSRVVQYGTVLKAGSGGRISCEKGERIVKTYAGAQDGGVLVDTVDLTGDALGTPCVVPTRTSAPHLGLTLEVIPRAIGHHEAEVTIYHNGNDEGFTTFKVTGDVVSGVHAEVTGASPQLPVQPVSDFPLTKVNARQTKTVYLKASGVYGSVNLTGFKIEGSSDIKVTGITRVGTQFFTVSSRRTCQFGSKALLDYSKQVGGGAGEDSFQLEGHNVSKVCNAGNLSSEAGIHFGLTLQFTPKQVGLQTGKITVFHDGNTQGFTTFDTSGEAY